MSGLAGRRVLVTRAAEDFAQLASLLRAREAEPISFPCVAIGPPENAGAVEAACARLVRDPPAAVALASPHAVSALFAELEKRAIDPLRALEKSLIGAAGEGTARALVQRGITAVAPQEGAGAGPLARLLIDRLNTNRWDRNHLASAPRIVIPQAAEASPQLAALLREAGFAVDSFAIYLTTLLAKLEAAHQPGLLLLREKKIDAIAFASGSAVRGFLRLLGDEAVPLAASTRVACIGASTALVARGEGFSVAVEGEHGFDSLLDLLAACYSAAPPNTSSREDTP